jgi:hypothetical protein
MKRGRLYDSLSGIPFATISTVIDEAAGASARLWFFETKGGMATI